MFNLQPLIYKAGSLQVKLQNAKFTDCHNSISQELSASPLMLLAHEVFAQVGRNSCNWFLFDDEYECS